MNRMPNQVPNDQPSVPDLSEVLVSLDIAEDRITDLARERDDAREELEALRQSIAMQDALADALLQFVREIDAGHWTVHWPLRVRTTFGLVRNLLDEIINPTEQRKA
jgi:hypothetical protein